MATQRQHTVSSSKGIDLPVFGVSGFVEGRTRTLDDGSLRWRIDGLVDREYVQSDLIRQDSMVVKAEDDSSLLEIWDGVGSVNGQLHYARFGAYFEDFDDGISFAPWHFGRVTPRQNIPMTGFASYSGLTGGVLLDNTGAYELKGSVLLNAEFNSGFFLLSGRLYDVVATGADGNQYGIMQMQLAGGKDPHTADSDPHFAGTVSGNFPNGESSNGGGGWSGRFFGPGLEELAANWGMPGEESQAYGWFGARNESSTHPSGPWPLPTLLTTAGVPLPVTTSVRSYELDADNKVVGSRALSSSVATHTISTNLRRPIVNYSINSTNRQVGIIDEPLYSYPVQLALSENQYLFSVGPASDLSYTAFGYWADNIDFPGTQTRWHFFHGGRETPLSQMPTTGSAAYLGHTYGAMAYREHEHIGTEFKSVQGQMYMQVDFASRALTAQSFLGFTNVDGGSGGFAELLLKGTVSGNGFSGTTSLAPSDVRPAATGTFNGKFYGPAAREAGGLWNFASTDGRLQSQGSFGVRLGERQ